MAPCKCLGKTSVVLLLSAALLVIAACTPVSAATTNTGDVVSAKAGTKKPLSITTYYDDMQEELEPANEKNDFSESDAIDAKHLYCVGKGNIVLDRRTGVDVTCTDRDILNWTVKSVIGVGVMNAVELHSDRLSVLKPDKEVTFPTVDALCTHFAVANHKEPVLDTDFLLFVAGAPMTAGERQAWGTWCGTTTQTTRPVAGAVNVAPRHVLRSFRLVSRLVAREILVALGFGYYTSGNHVTRVTVRETTGVPVVKPQTALTKAQAHFGCKEMANMELEYTEKEQKALPYWRSRVMKDDLMALNQIAGYYTDITLAAMADLGFYDVDYTKAEDMPWGRGWGCKFVTNKCVTSGKSAVENVFCTNADTVLTCTTDRYALGVCDLMTHKANLPKSFQYFADKPTEGGAQFAMDYCPVIVPKQAYHYCSLGLGGGVKNFVFGEASRCLDIDTAIPFDKSTTAKGVCVKVQCNSKSTTTYKVSFDGTNYVDCKEGAKINVPSSTANGKGAAATNQATCPPYTEVCGTNKVDPEPHHSSSSHHSSHHSGSSHHSSHHDSALTVAQSVWGVTLSLAMVLFMIM